jgi:hypothetical protein
MTDPKMLSIVPSPAMLSCINCVRPSPEYKKSYEWGHRHGFEIIGVHAPELDTAYSVEKVHGAASVQAKTLKRPAGNYSPKPLGRANIKIRTGVEAKRADVKTPIDCLLEEGSKSRLGVLGSRRHLLVE